MQQREDSLSANDYNELKELFYESDSISKSKVYALAYLNKGKKEKNPIEVARGYKFLSLISEDSLAFKYSDSIIQVTKNLEHRSYPALGYYQKGAWLFHFGNYKEALDNYLLAQKHALKHNNIGQLMDIKLAIAALKDRYGEYDEALVIYREHLEYVYNEDIKDEKLDALYNVGNGYLRTRNIDSAFSYINKGLKESKEVQDDDFYNEFLSSYAYCSYFNKQFKIAIDTLKIVIPNESDYGKSMSYYYMGKCYDKLGNIEKAILYLKKSDSMYKITKDAFPELHDIYEILKDDAKKRNNLEEQLIYIEKLLKIDSVLNLDFKYISKNIIRKFDIELLLKEKEKIIQQQNKKSTFIILSLLLLSAILILIALYYKRQQNKYKRRFKQLISESKDIVAKKEKKNDIEVLLKEDIGIPKDVIDILLRKLNRFEKETLFLEKDSTLNNVAKRLQTNSAYLSKIINHYKGEKFNSYINELRINYGVEKLKDNKQFRKYSISSIADELGYANPQSFANSFYKITGLRPSYFIKKLNSEKV